MEVVQCWNLSTPHSVCSLVVTLFDMTLMQGVSSWVILISSPPSPSTPPSWSDKQWVNRNMVMLQWELQETVKCWTGWPQRAQWPGHLLIAFPISTINRSQQNIRKIYRRVPVYLSIYLTIVTLPTHGRHRYTEVPSLVRATAAH